MYVCATCGSVCSPPLPSASALAKKTFRPTVHVPGLQYVAKVDADSSADAAGLKEGDFLLEVSWCIDPLLCMYVCMYVHTLECLRCTR